MIGKNSLAFQIEGSNIKNNIKQSKPYKKEVDAFKKLLEEKANEKMDEAQECDIQISKSEKSDETSNTKKQDSKNDVENQDDGTEKIKDNHIINILANALTTDEEKNDLSSLDKNERTIDIQQVVNNFNSSKKALLTDGNEDVKVQENDKKLENGQFADIMKKQGEEPADISTKAIGENIVAEKKNLDESEEKQESKFEKVEINVVQNKENSQRIDNKIIKETSNKTVRTYQSDVIIDTNAENVSNKLTEAMIHKFENGIYKFEIELLPKELGKVKIEMVFDKDITKLILTTTNHKAHEILSNQGDIIKNILQGHKNQDNDMNYVKESYAEIIAGDRDNFQEENKNSSSNKKKQKKKVKDISFEQKLRLGILEVLN